jgi:hypothetical protein
MSRQFMSILLSSVLIVGSVTTSAFSAPAATGTAQTRANESPLPAGGAAGIKQAQGFDNPALAVGIVVGIFLIGVLLLHDDDDDDNDGPATTGT